MNEKKYFFPVALLSEGIAEGYMKLTRDEAELVARVVNPRNWIDSEVEKYCGSFVIDLDRSIPEEWFDYHKSHDNRRCFY